MLAIPNLDPGGNFTDLLCCAYLLSHVWLFVTPWSAAHQAPLSMGILQARILQWVAIPSSRASSPPRDWTQVFHTAGKFFLYSLSLQGSPRILEWVAYPFSRGSSQPRNRTRVCTHKNSLSYNHICVLHTSHNSIQKVGCENGCWILNIGPESIPNGTLSPCSLSFTWLPDLPQPSLQE